MSNDTPPPGEPDPRDDAPPSDASSADELPPTEAIGAVGSSEPSTDGTDSDVTPVDLTRPAPAAESGASGGAPPPDPTQVVPVVPVLPGERVGAGATTSGDQGRPGPHTAAPAYQPLPPPPAPPWYRNPAVIGSVAFLVIAVGVIALLFALRDDGDSTSLIDDSPTDDAVVLSIERVDVDGTPVPAQFDAVVWAEAPGVDPVRWIEPEVAERGQPARKSTDSAGRAVFRWGPLAGDEAVDWSSTIVLLEAVPIESSPPLPVASCTLTRDEVPIEVVAGVQGVSDVEADTGEVTATSIQYTFPNLELRVADVLSCRFEGPPSGAATSVPADTTTSTEPLTSTTTDPDPTTTVEETTTVPATTDAPATTDVPATTVPATTVVVTTTTTTTTTVAPDPVVLSDVLASRTDLTSFAELLDTAGLLDDLDATDAPVTVFAPTDAAFDALAATVDPPDLSDPAVAQEIALDHLAIGSVFTSAQLESVTALTVESGDTLVVQPVGDGLQVGGANVIERDLTGDVAIVHVLDAIATTS